ncbi:long-chain fatty acid transport protein [Desulfocurvibacter africanus PCS]|uniref:Long-chain fatty acid transport protein n=1 Tax=Desulfocurvibacter africanus PCS TaxID=1262666 RepID=M5PNX9_DESAF|nr:outer membrane protein transport protein [Desulfocurvibacter africanus]EMG35629.1 long-chain fatty acid transport protein [Desulfocurvibacter africanus PCS]
MRRVLHYVLVAAIAALLFPCIAGATNGDNLIAIGPIARSMGGVGVAAPQDAISAVFANPAAMCFGPYCPSSEVNFAGTAFMPDVKAKITIGGQTFEADGDDNVYPIPALGISVPISEQAPFWRFGFAAYGVSGLGVDYRDTDLDQAQFADFGGFPLASGTYTQLNVLKFAPAVAVQPLDWLSVGVAAHIGYASLDLQNGQSSGFAPGVQVGAIFKPMDKLHVGLNYISAQKVNHRNVADFDGDGLDDDLELESPQQASLGVAYDFLNGALLVEADVKWINWADAQGYDDFDWDNQWVYALGLQYRPIQKLALRAGYNYGKNPVNEHDGFQGTGTTTVQGKNMPTYYYETFRIIGFPAIVEHHLTFGVGWSFTPRFTVDAGYMHAFKNTIEESGTALNGQPASIESTLQESSIELGLTWRF